MPMMRRGPLDRYPVEWVLRQASAHQSSGSIEFNAPRPITVFLHGGRIYHAVRGVAVAGEALPVVSAPAEEPAARARVVDVIATALGTTGGWYFHDPLGRHDERGPWLWETAALLMDARVRANDDSSLGRWATSEVALHLPPVPTAVTLEPDAWAVVVALAEAVEASEIRTRLGWTSERLISALEDLAGAGALRPTPGQPGADGRPRSTPAPPPAPIAPEPPAPAGDGSGPAVRRSGPPPAAPRPTPRPVGRSLGSPGPDRRRHPDPVADAAAAAAAIEAAESVLAQAGASVRAEPRARVGAADPRHAVDVGVRHTGPLTPPTVAAAPAGDPGSGTDDGDDRRSALRRLISSLRPS